LVVWRLIWSLKQSGEETPPPIAEETPANRATPQSVAKVKRVEIMMCCSRVFENR
jgi:hypothetical protein